MRRSATSHDAVAYARGLLWHAAGVDAPAPVVVHDLIERVGHHTPRPREERA